MWMGMDTVRLIGLMCCCSKKVRKWMVGNIKVMLVTRSVSNIPPFQVFILMVLLKDKYLICFPFCGRLWKAAFMKIFPVRNTFNWKLKPPNINISIIWKRISNIDISMFGTFHFHLEVLLTVIINIKAQFYETILPGHYSHKNVPQYRLVDFVQRISIKTSLNLK